MQVDTEVRQYSRPTCRIRAIYCGYPQNVRQKLDEIDQRIVAALLLAPRISRRALSTALDIPERTLVRRVGPLYADGTLRATAVPNPACFPDLIPLVLRVRCRPNRVTEVADVMARRPDTVWVDILGGDEVCTVHFLDGPQARTDLLLRQLVATLSVTSWTFHEFLRIFPTAFTWSGGILTEEQARTLSPELPLITEPIPIREVDQALIRALIHDSRAPYRDLAQRAKVSPVTARHRVEALVAAGTIRLATEVDLTLLGIRAEALVWMTVPPSILDETGQRLAQHPQVRFAGAVTGTATLFLAVAAPDLAALYTFLTETIGAINPLTTLETAPILTTVKRTGLARLPRPHR